MKKLFCITVTLAFLTSIATAQPRLNDEKGNLNYRDNELLINPAYLGGVESYVIGAGFNKQWTGIDKSPMAEQLQFQLPLAHNGGLGAYVYNESYGPQNNTQFAVAYAYKLQMANNTGLALGLNLSLLMMHEKPVSGNDPNDPVFPTTSGTQLGFNAGFGAYYFGEKFYAGFSIPQLLTNDLETNVADPKLKNKLDFGRMQYYFTGGYRFALADKFSLIPSALLAFSGATDFGYEVMLTGDYNRFIEVGAGFAAHSCLKIAAGVNINKNIGVRYQFSQNLGNDYKNFGSSHFITLRFSWGRAKTTFQSADNVNQ